MTDRSAVWIAFTDLALSILAVVIVAVAPTKAKTDGVKEKAEYLLTAEWNVGVDADVDLWTVGPNHKPLFYGSRDVGCATLDRDNRGFLDSVIHLSDGTTTTVSSNKETASIRCIELGRYDLGVNLYQYRENHEGVSRHDLGLKVHVEIIALNPQVRTVLAKDVTLDGVGQTVNWASFDIARDGTIALADPPLESITKTYQHQNSGAYTPGGAP